MKKMLIVLLFVILSAAAGAGWLLVKSPNVQTELNPRVLYIPTGADYAEVLSILKMEAIVKESITFDLWARFRKYPASVKPGRYLLTRNMNNREIVNLLKSGRQSPVTLVIYDIWIKEQLCEKIGRTMEMDSSVVMELLQSDTLCKRWGTDTARILSHIIADNYEIFWNAGTRTLVSKWEKAYETFWNEERKAKAALINLNQEEVYTLASIVERECMKDSELKTVAGVYLNRLRIDMPLQADPTLKFATRDLDARRVLNIHKDFDSPWNTYMYKGLPPGPISMPRKKTIDAVLNAEKHNYLYFCANPDLSGYSVFSETYEEQMRVARLFQRKMNKMDIR